MNPFLRWARFNAVGVLGMGVQLAALAGFNRLFAGHYLVATCAALEITLLHNFWWHERFTWADRRHEMPGWRALLRFHAANGVVSLCGNLLLMRLLMQGAHLPLLLADGAAILCCSLANFALSSRWAFAVASSPTVKLERITAMRATLLLLSIALLTLSSRAQSDRPLVPLITKEPILRLRSDAFLPRAQTLPNGPQPTRQSPSSDSYFYNEGVFCSVGVSSSSVATKPTFGCGAGLTLVPFPLFIEFGVTGPQANRSYLSGYVSVDARAPIAPLRWTYSPQILFGYSRLFETGHALDYGMALAMPRNSNKHGESRSLRIELRDYWTFANPSQHNVVLRVGWMVEEYRD